MIDEAALPTETAPDRRTILTTEEPALTGGLFLCPKETAPALGDAEAGEVLLNLCRRGPGTLPEHATRRTVPDETQGKPRTYLCVLEDCNF